jgi:hypothetical protein
MVEHPAAAAENCIEARALITELERSLAAAQITAAQSQAAALEVTAVLARLRSETISVR